MYKQTTESGTQLECEAICYFLSYFIALFGVRLSQVFELAESQFRPMGSGSNVGPNCVPVYDQKFKTVSGIASILE